MRRDNGASYDEYVAQLMANEGIEEPTPAERQRFDRRSKKSLSNREWVNPHDPEARITKLKDGRTQLAYKAEHAVDLDTGAVVALTVQPADRGDPESLRVTLAEAGNVVAQMAGQAAEAGAVGPVEAVSPVGVERVVADKGYHSQPVLEELAAVGVRTVIAEPQRQRRRWAGQRAAQAAVYANRRRLRTPRGKALMRRRDSDREKLRPFVRDGRLAAGTLAQPGQHRQTPAASRRRLQFELDPATTAGGGHGPASGGPSPGFIHGLSCHGQRAV